MTNARERVVHADELAWEEIGPPGEVQQRRRRLASAAGGEGLGCSLVELPPGGRSWPYHYHLGNEEAIYVLEGAGVLRLGGEEVELAAGDYVALHAAPEGAHQVRNPGGSALRYLCLSTMSAPDIAIYPDSDKVGLFAGAAPGGPQDERTLTAFLRRSAEVDYWDGEAGPAAGAGDR